MKTPLVIAAILLAPALAVAARLASVTDLSRAQAQAVVMTGLAGTWVLYRLLGLDARGRRRRRLLGYRLEDLDRLPGSAFEDWVAAVLDEGGCQVERTPATRDFGVDLIATVQGRRIGIEAKRHQRPISNQAVRSVVAGSEYHTCEGAAVVTQSTFTESARRQAARARVPVLLIGRQDLHRLVNILFESSKTSASPSA